MLNSEEKALFAELKAKDNLTAVEHVQLNKLIKKSKKRVAAKGAEAVNVFAVKTTTEVTPIPVRLIKQEVDGLTARVLEITTNDLSEVMDVLGHTREVNQTKLLRAAVFLMQERSNKEIINAIDQVRKNMKANHPTPLSLLESEKKKKKK